MSSTLQAAEAYRPSTEQSMKTFSSSSFISVPDYLRSTNLLAYAHAGAFSRTVLMQAGSKNAISECRSMKPLCRFDAASADEGFNRSAASSWAWQKHAACRDLKAPSTIVTSLYIWNCSSPASTNRLIFDFSSPSARWMILLIEIFKKRQCPIHSYSEQIWLKT